MCGITAYLEAATNDGQSTKAHSMVLEGISILQNRGYDSAGIATLGHGSTICCQKWAGPDCLKKLEATAEAHSGHHVAIAHTRWATHGGVNDANAHPHLDWKNRVAVVHNGIIENYTELKNFLISEGVPFRSETDTEVIANTIGYFLDQHAVKNMVDESEDESEDMRSCESECQSFDSVDTSSGRRNSMSDCSLDPPHHCLEAAVESALERLEGTWGLAIIGLSEPDKLILAKNGSPLLLGWTKEVALAASQSSAISRHCKQHIVIEDGVMLTASVDPIVGEISIHKNRRLVHNPESDLKIIRTVDSDAVELSPDPWNHWMEKEIMEQPDSLLRTMNMGGRIKDEYEVRLGGLENHVEDLMDIHHLIILACGTSLNASRVGMIMFKNLQIFKTVEVIDASEFDLIDLPNNVPEKNVGLLVLSQSGETKDVHRAMELVEDKGIKVFSIVNVPGTLIAREAIAGVYLNAGREVGVASTKSFTSQILALGLIAVWFSQKLGTHKQNRAQIIRDIHSLSLGTNEVLQDLHKSVKVNELAVRLVDRLNNGMSSMFILGRGICKFIADEASLKMKEIGYAHAEGYAGGALKHGPFALIEKGTPIFIIAPNDNTYPKMRIAAEEVHARGADVCLITDVPSDQLDSKERELYSTIFFLPPGNKSFVSTFAILPFQLLCYEMALLMGHNPDKPRNLAKVVTVDG